MAGDEIPLLAEQAVRPLLLALEVVLRGGELDADEAKRLLTSPLGRPSTRWRCVRSAVCCCKQNARPPGRPSWAARLVSWIDVLSEPERLTELPETPEVGSAAGARGTARAAGRTLTVPGTGAAEVLWTLWSGTDWAERLQRASRDGGESGRRADRDLDAVIALFAAAAATEQPAGAGGVRGFRLRWRRKRFPPTPPARPRCAAGASGC